MPIFERPGADQVPWRDRVAAAEALGRAGDPRLARSDDYLLLPLPGHEILLGRFLVTMQEYGRFVDSRGYEQQRWWTSEGWAWREQLGWDEPGEWEQQLAHPSRPVVGVSWHEADAYCRWLTEMRGRKVRLPAQEEWQAACATGGDYPWGAGEPTPEHANFAENAGAPTPVGVYPRGAGPHGHLDLAGNVWEWSADEYEQSAEESKVYGDTGRWSYLRGGCSTDRAQYLRSAYRDRYQARWRSADIGFRVAVARASP